MSIVAVVTGAAIASWWVLEQLDIIPAGRLQTRLARTTVAVLVVVMFAVPTASQNAMQWFVDRKTNEMLDIFQPALDDLDDQDEPDPVLDDPEWFTPSG